METSKVWVQSTFVVGKHSSGWPQNQSLPLVPSAGIPDLCHHGWLDYRAFLTTSPILSWSTRQCRDFQMFKLGLPLWFSEEHEHEQYIHPSGETTQREDAISCPVAQCCLPVWGRTRVPHVESKRRDCQVAPGYSTVLAFTGVEGRNWWSSVYST